MINTFKDIINLVKLTPKRKVAIACAADDSVLLSAICAYNEKILDFILFDKIEKIKKVASDLNINISNFELVDCDSDSDAAKKAVLAVKNGEADILMKGHLSTSTFLKAILDKQNGLKNSDLLSHVQIFECPITNKLKIISDGGMNLYPDYNALCSITKNAIDAYYKICNKVPNVALINSSIDVENKISKTFNDMVRISYDLNITLNNQSVLIDGPITLDLAYSNNAIKRKNKKLKFDPPADVFIVPNIETGNIFGKSLIYFAKARSAGLICGTIKPVIMLSRADDPETKMNSMAIGALVSKF